jgi:ribonuclease HI
VSTWTVWTDGSGTTGGAAGIGYVAQSPDEPESVLGSLPLENATNQQAELLAAALALHELPAGSMVTVVSDSEYLVKGWNEYPKRKRNLPHWSRLTQAAKRHRSVAFEWTRGHAGTEQNELADRLAGAARQVAIRQASTREERAA